MHATPAVVTGSDGAAGFSPVRPRSGVTPAVPASLRPLAVLTSLPAGSEPVGGSAYRRPRAARCCWSSLLTVGIVIPVVELRGPHRAIGAAQVRVATEACA